VNVRRELACVVRHESRHRCRLAELVRARAVLISVELLVRIWKGVARSAETFRVYVSAVDRERSTGPGGELLPVEYVRVALLQPVDAGYQAYM
jgi:hypothetical protein